MPITRTWDSASYSLGLGTLPVRPPYSHRVTGALLAQLPGALCQDQARGRQGRGKRVGGWVDAGTRVPGRRELPNLLRQRTRRPGLRGSCFQIWKRRGNPPGQAPTSAFGKKTLEVRCQTWNGHPLGRTSVPTFPDLENAGESRSDSGPRRRIWQTPLQAGPE